MKYSLIVVILIMLAGCANIEQSPKPENFYGDEKMSAILTDLYLLESSMTSDRRKFTELKTLPNDYIYKMYDTDSITFKENLFYYADRTEEYLKIMENVEARLKVIQDSIAARQVRASKAKMKNYQLQDSLIPVDPDNQIQPVN